MTGAASLLPHLQKRLVQLTQLHSDPSVFRLFFCKVREAILKEMMLAHLSQFSRLMSWQLGSLPHRLTLTNLIVVEELVTRWFDERSAADLTYQDFCKAFDSVNHRLLTAKLRGYVIALTVIT